MNVDNSNFKSKKKLKTKGGWSRGRDMILSVRNYFKAEAEVNEFLHPPTKIVERTAAALSISIATVKRACLSQHMHGPIQKPGTKSVRKCTVTDVDDFNANAIRNHIYGYYTNRTYPTLDKLFTSLREAGLFEGSRTSLYHLLLKLNFSYQKVNGRKILLERPDIVALRAKFVRRICEIEDWSNIVWLDETWVNVGHAPSKAWTNDTKESTMPVPVGKGKRVIVVHAGTQDGFVKNAGKVFESKKSKNGQKSSDYHDDMNQECFMEWFTMYLLPNIKPNSKIVIDNAPYHTTYLEKPPTMATKKQEIIDWLIEKEICTAEEFQNIKITKAELLLKVEPYRKQFSKYRVDEVAREAGHEIIRLPPYHCHFNPIEMIWATVKGYVGKENREHTIPALKKLTEEAIEMVPLSNWFNAVQHCKKLIEASLVDEGIRDSHVEEMIINFPQNDDDSDDDIFFGDELEFDEDEL